ncbi:MAG TPA: tetratricopeptide repeat protein [Bryobacteraceae bacterium]|nr:tetratricopeptide repeat protein [Bryobacteraceae bacterium]
MIRLAKALLLVVAVGSVLLAQTPQIPADTANAPDNKAGAYFNFAMGRLYAELAANEGVRSEYVTKAIQHYQEALKLDPSASIIFEELTDLYIQTGRLRDAISQAEEMLQQNPDNLDARRMLGRIYLRSAENQQGRVDEANVRRAVEQYQKITEKDPKDAESWVTLGRLYMISNNSPEAEKAFNAALLADPDNDEAVTHLAALYAFLGDSKRAIEKLKAATARNPTEQTLSALAEQYEQMNDFKNAAEARKKVMELSPDDGRNARSLAADLMYSDQLDEALKLYEQLATEEPRDGELLLDMSKIQVARHDLAKAREALNKARALDPQSLSVRYQEVKILEAEGKAPEALTSLKSILDDTARKTYSDADAHRRANLLDEYGVLLRNGEKYSQAVEVFRQMGALSADTAPHAAAQLVDTYRQAKDYDNALREAEAAMKKFPNERTLKVEHATVIADQGKVDAAAAELRSLLNGDHDRETYLSLAQLFEKAKRYPEMGAALDNAEKQSADNEDKELIYFMRGAMFERMKRFDASEAQFRKVLEWNPENAGAMNYLGYMLADRNVRLDEAYQLVKKALDMEPDNGAYLDSLGWVYYRQGKLDEAQSLLQKALDHIGQDPTVHDHLGDVFIKMGKTREAIAQWTASLKAYQSGSQTDSDPDEMATVTKKLDAARVRLAQETKQK